MADVSVSAEMLLSLPESCLFNSLRVCNEGTLPFKSLGVLGRFSFNSSLSLTILANPTGTLIGLLVRPGLGDPFGLTRTSSSTETALILPPGRDGISLLGRLSLSLFSF